MDDGFAPFCGEILADQKAIWTSPFSTWRTHEIEWLACTSAAALLYLADRKITSALPRRREEIAISKWASRAGTIYVAGIFLGGVYAAGRILRHDCARKVGLLGMRIVCDTELAGNVLKISAQRPRPTEKGGSGRFWSGGYGFPSGHSMKTWALAAAIAREFPGRRAVTVLAYALAGTVSLARVFGFRHFASDAFAGAVIGWHIGNFVQRRSARQNVAPSGRQGGFEVNRLG